MLNRVFNPKIRAVQKVDGLREGVNLRTIALLAFLVTACSGSGRGWQAGIGSASPRPGPAGEATALRAAGEPVVAWRVSLGRSLTGPLEEHGAVLLGATGNGAVVAVSTADGRRLWRARVGGVLPGLTVLDDHWAFAAGAEHDGVLHGLTLRDGRRAWRRAVGATSRPPAVADGQVYLVADSGDAYAFDAASGTAAWHTRLSGRPLATPVIHEEHLFVVTAADTVYRLDRRTGATTGTAVLPSPISARPVLAGGALVLPLYSGALAAVDLATLRLEAIVELDAPTLASPLPAADGTLVVLTRAATLWSVRPATRAAEPIAEFGGAARGSLAKADGRLYVGLLDGRLIALNANGTELWRTRLDDSIVAPVTAVGGTVFVPLLRGDVVRLEVAR